MSVEIEKINKFQGTFLKRRSIEIYKLIYVLKRVTTLSTEMESAVEFLYLSIFLPRKDWIE